MSISKKKLAYVHIVKKELELEDEEYRDILDKVAGVRSSKDLDEEGFAKLIRFLVKSGKYVLNKDGLTIKQKYYILRLARDLEWDKAHLDNFIKKYYHVENLERLSRKKASKLIESLKNVKEHHSS